MVDIFSQQSLFQLVLLPAQHFSWCTLHMLNKQGDSVQSCPTPSSILKQSVVSCLVLTVASWQVSQETGKLSGTSFMRYIFYFLCYCCVVKLSGTTVRFLFPKISNKDFLTSVSCHPWPPQWPLIFYKQFLWGSSSFHKNSPQKFF